MTAVSKAGERIEELIAQLRPGADGTVAAGDPAATAEELVSLLVGLYGEGLASILRVLAAHGPAGDHDRRTGR